MKISNKILICIFICLLLITGCESTNKKSVNIPDNESVDATKMKHKHCTRKGSIGDKGEVQLEYDLYYTGELLNIIKSVEKVISTDNDTLNTYEDAYRKIHASYEGLEYYETNLERTDDSVTSYMLINYDKIDIQRLVEIEGEEDNIIENGKAKVQKWLDLTKKLGMECEEVEE